jgi:glycosyltransferase involved in cell wall biosynthesis
MISVIVPALNEENGIEECLISICHQSLDRKKFEVIVVDGGSKDGTASKAERYADLVIEQKGKGIGGGRRDGASAASGEILAFTDADTIVSNGWLEAISRNLEWKDASTGPVIYLEPDLGARMLQRWRSLYRLFSVSNFCYIIGSNMAVRSEAYWKIGGHGDISLLDDYDLSLRLCQGGFKAAYDPGQAVYTSSRRTGRLPTYTLTVAYGHYHYLISGKHERLLNYPKPEEMRLSAILPLGRYRSLQSSREELQESIESRLKRIF